MAIRRTRTGSNIDRGRELSKNLQVADNPDQNNSNSRTGSRSGGSRSRLNVPGQNDSPDLLPGLFIPGRGSSSSSSQNNSSSRTGSRSGGNGGTVKSEELPDYLTPTMPTPEEFDRRTRGGSSGGNDSGGNPTRRTRQGGISTRLPVNRMPVDPAPAPSGNGSNVPDAEEENRRTRNVREDSRDSPNRPYSRIRRSGLNRGSDAMRESNIDDDAAEQLGSGNQFGEMAESGSGENSFFANFSGGGSSGTGPDSSGEQNGQTVTTAGFDLTGNSFFGLSLVIAAILIFIGVSESE